MRKGDPLDAIVSKQVLKWDYLATSEENLEALERLAKDGRARSAWAKLAAMVEGDDFAMAVSSIARAAALSHLKHSDRRTKAEISEAATDAADLAKRLVRLIENNGALQSFGARDIHPPLEMACLDRIAGGLLNLATLSKGSGGRWFGPEIESILDKQQAEKWPEFNGLTTSEAYRLTVSNLWARDAFIEHLRNFSEFALMRQNTEPPTQKPKAKNAAQHVFAGEVCTVLNHFSGSPHHDIAAAIVSAAFNEAIDTELVKSWWKRRRDKT